MTPFRTLDGVAAALPLSNVDTDKIVAGRFLKTITRKGLGAVLFSTLREDPAFVLNVAPWDRAAILIALDNFGCGSSREHAPWALLDFGFRCLIATSIADIFHNNCFKIGILPIVLPEEQVAALMTLARDPATARLVVSLEAQTVTTVTGEVFAFTIDPGRKQELIEGADEIGRSLELTPAIDRFEADRRAREPWFPAIDAAVLAHD